MRLLLVWNLVVFFTHLDYVTPVQNSHNETLNQFRKLVDKELTQEYMHTDTFLKRWLDVGNGDLKVAIRKLKKTLKWRKETNIDNLINEDFSTLEEDYPVYLNFHDKQGRPIGLLDIGKWNLRAASVEGLMPKLIRYMIHAAEQAAWKAYHAEKRGIGDGSTIGLIDLDGFSSPTHLCKACASLQIQFFECLEIHYPNLFRKLICINTPPSFQFIYNGLQAVVSDRSKKAFTIMRDESKWRPYLDSIIDRDQRNTNYGGTREP